jgi:general secretion pathway protein A
MEEKFNRFFNLALNPFGETPDRRFFFASSSHCAAVDGLIDAVRKGKGFALLKGEVGTGKTLLTRVLIGSLGDSTDVALILYPRCNEIELLKSICEELKIDHHLAVGEPRRDDRKLLVDRLNERLLANAKVGRRTVLVIDEAQNLSDETLETVRLLGNLETEQRKLLNIILVAQPELESRLSTVGLRQLKQRISASFALRPLDEAETEEYIRFRLEKAGGGNLVRFDADALALIHRSSRGIPREINCICDLILSQALRQKIRLIQKGLVREVLINSDKLPARSVFPKWLSPRFGAGSEPGKIT